MTDSATPSRCILLTGATGYVGGRLAPLLLEHGYRVRCVARSARKLRDRPWAGHENLEIFEADVQDTDALAEAMRGCEAAYYLIHSMQAAGGKFAEKDRQLAGSFAAAAGRGGVGRIIYLGGLGEMGEGLSGHLRSRREVERVLAEGPVPVTALRAAMILGSGSASFEILRYLVERLPVMVTPRWVGTECQPIAIRNVLEYLMLCLTTPQTEGEVLDIGGPDVLTYRALMQEMAAALGLPRRRIVPVPLLTPRLSSLWIHLVTPLNAKIARPLAEGLSNRVVARDDRAARLMPQRLMGVREAIDLALKREEDAAVDTAWSDAGPLPGDPDWAGGTVFGDSRSVEIAAPPEAVFEAVCRVGGGHGWYAADRLWKIRGWMDQWVGGPGLRRGRRHPHRLAYGDALDFWRVTAVDRPTRLRLRAEMKLPGEALLAFDIEPGPKPNTSVLHQTARFQPHGLAGIGYWYTVKPFHNIVFHGMLNGIRREAEGPREREAA